MTPVTKRQKPLLQQSFIAQFARRCAGRAFVAGGNSHAQSSYPGDGPIHMSATLLRHGLPASRPSWMRAALPLWGRVVRRCAGQYGSPHGIDGLTRPGAHLLRASKDAWQLRPVFRRASARARPKDRVSHVFENQARRRLSACPRPNRALAPLARCSLDKVADLFLDGGAEPPQGKGGWPDVTVVEVCGVLETERRVSRLELLPALEEADNLAVLGVRGHPVPDCSGHHPPTPSWLLTSRDRDGR